MENGGVYVCMFVCVGGEGSRKFLDEGGDSMVGDSDNCGIE